MKNSKKALTWIVGILKKHNVHFQISGGLAARVYGAIRELADIDVYVSSECFEKIKKDTQRFIIKGPKAYKDDQWRVWYVALKYCGQEIELCDAANTYFFDKTRGKWIKQKINFQHSNFKEVFGLKVPVMAKAELIAYKKRIQRRVDIIDIKQLLKVKE